MRSSGVGTWSRRGSRSWGMPSTRPWSSSAATTITAARGTRGHAVPVPLASGGSARVAGLAVAGLEWPGVGGRDNRRRDRAAWPHVLRVFRRSAWRRLTGRDEPILVISHAPPAGAGDAPSDAYHVGIRAYRWLLERTPAAALAARPRHDRIGPRR